MELKKSNQKNLENKKSLFFEVGLATALLIAFVAFEWNTGVPRPMEQIVLTGSGTDELPAVVFTPPQAPPPVEKVKVAMIIDNFVISNTDSPSIDFVVDPDKIDVSKYTPMTFAPLKPENESDTDTVPIYKVSVRPTINGKDANSFTAWVYSQLKYPEEAERNGIEGAVILGFVIGKDGKLSNIEVLRSPDPILTNEVVRIVRTSPDWTPGMQGTKKVNVSYQLTIKFKIQ